MVKTHDQHPNAVIYCQIMEQLKWRIAEVEQTLLMVKLRQHYLKDLAAAEFCLLQLRIVCELIALGCVAVNTDIPSNKKLKKKWHAGEIMALFAHLKKDYFPTKIIEKKLANGVIDQTNVYEGQLNSTKLIERYEFFGGMLHAGSFNALLKPKKHYDLSILDKFVEDIKSLLSIHIFTLHDKKLLIRVTMNCISDGKVWWNQSDILDEASSRTPSA